MPRIEPSKPAVLYEDNHLLALAKPAGMATMGTEAGIPSLIDWAKQYLKERYQKPGNVYLGTVSRVDKPVSGVVVFARTSKAAARLSAQFRDREVEKVYWAVVSGKVSPAQGELSHLLLHDDAQQRVRVVSAQTAGAAEAHLAYRVLQSQGDLTLVEVRPTTGRKHQIRVQLAAQDWPIVGDRKYGSRLSFPGGIALHARSLVVAHPTRGEPMEFIADPPEGWRRLGFNL